MPKPKKRITVITVDLTKRKRKLETGCTCNAVAAMERRRAAGRTATERRHLETIATTLDRAAAAHDDDVLAIVAGVILGWSECPFDGWLRASIRDTVIDWALRAPKAQLAELAVRAERQARWVEYYDSPAYARDQRAIAEAA